MPSTTATLDRLNSALADRYRIERELGSGGMATVYLAHDLKHDRDVAIKVLHPDLGAALGSDRFLSEIRTTARLQHPHILPLLDSGEADGLLYYVMPLVKGETLRARLERERQLPIPEAIRIARETASALDYAHRQGVIHRDIKPENILLHDGQALVADFGIALAVQQAGGQRMTQTGLSLGTPQYMSPEQAMGERGIDARTDVYALGAVTYEMMTGDPPFTGSSVQAIVAKVLAEKPTPLHTVRDTVPPGVEQAVLTALAKLPADRFATAAEFAAALTSQGATVVTELARPRGRRARDPVVIGLGAALLILGAALTLTIRRSLVQPDPFPVRIVISGSTEAPSGPAVLSPDGQSLVFRGQGPAGQGATLYLRRLDQLTSRALPGTATAIQPVFSPDGKWIAFIAGRRQIVKLPLDGGAAVPLAEVPDYGGIDWSLGGDIVVGGGIMEGRLGLFRVNAAGGALEPLTRVDTSRKELSHQFPRVLADGKTVLFTIWYGSLETAELAAASLDDGKVVRLGIPGTHAIGVAGGQLVYSRGDGRALAIPFDVGRRRPTGIARPVQDSIRLRAVSGGTGSAEASLTHEGGLVYARGAAARRLVWVNQTGVATPAVGETREFEYVRLSPDGGRVAVGLATGTKGDLWILDLATSTLTRLTSIGTARNPNWSSDGRRVLYVSTHGGRAGFWWHPADGSGPPTEAGAASHNPWNVDLAPDGRTTVYNALYDGTFNLETFTLDSTHVQRELAASPTATEANGRFSPDGRAVAYVSNESGRTEVYARPFPEEGGRVQISVGGGTRAVWSPDGKRLYFWEGTRLTAATLARDPALRVVSRETLFEGNYEQDFDVSRDGTRFLMIESSTSGMELIVVPNWLTELEQTAKRP